MSSKPVKVKELGGAILTGAVQVSAGMNTSMAVKTDGTVWAWGQNNSGQLGQNNTTNSYYAVKVKDTTGTDYLKNIKEVHLGANYFAIALTNDKKLYSWGKGTGGQLGNSSTGNKSIPVEVKNLTDVKEIVIGNNFSIALKEDKSVWAWGYNAYGQLGDGTVTNRTSPVQTKLDASTVLSNVITVGANYGTAYALTEDGTVYGWGLNTEGQIGDNTVVNKSYPTVSVRIYNQELEKNIVKLLKDSPCSYTNYFIKKDGTILGNGRVSSGQLIEVHPEYANRAYIEDIQQSYLEITDRISYIKQGESKKLTARIEENLNAFAKAPEMGKVTWKSTNENVATVDENGNVKAKETGVTTIIIEEDKWGYSGQAKVYVTSNEK